MLRRRLLLAALTLSPACATTHYFDANGEKMPGFPFTYFDPRSGGLRLAYVRTSTGFGTASFTVTASDPKSAYTEFTNNLDSTGAATLAGGLLDQIATLREESAETNARVEESSVLLEDLIRGSNLPEDQKARLLDRKRSRMPPK